MLKSLSCILLLFLILPKGNALRFVHFENEKAKTDHVINMIKNRANLVLIGQTSSFKKEAAKNPDGDFGGPGKVNRYRYTFEKSYNINPKEFSNSRLEMRYQESPENPEAIPVDTVKARLDNKFIFAFLIWTPDNGGTVLTSAEVTKAQAKKFSNAKLGVGYFTEKGFLYHGELGKNPTPAKLYETNIKGPKKEIASLVIVKKLTENSIKLDSEILYFPY